MAGVDRRQGCLSAASAGFSVSGLCSSLADGIRHTLCPVIACGVSARTKALDGVPCGGARMGRVGSTGPALALSCGDEARSEPGFLAQCCCFSAEGRALETPNSLTSDCRPLKALLSNFV